MAVYRTAGPWGPGKGANLTAAEFDGNIFDHETRITGLEESPATGGIASATVTGSQLTLHLANGTSLAPVEIPKAIIRYRGTWLPNIAYSVLDSFAAPDGGFFLVLRAHTSAATFARSAADAEGPLYQYLFPMRGETLAALSDVADTAPTDGQALVWDAALAAWKPGASGGGGGTLAALTDVYDFMEPANGQVLRFNGSDWDAADLATNLDGLSDVFVQQSFEGDALIWDSVMLQWVARPPGQSPAGVFTLTANYTFTVSSPGSFADYNGTAAGVFTIPTDAAAAISVGSVIRGGRLNTGSLRILASAGVTLNGIAGGFVDLAGTTSEYVLRKRAPNTWRISVTATPVVTT